ncbi:hypothetical protein G5V59_12700 [Nocardioides sp. W3-2-3]|uniref:hypothetical protein n=1 Tax=Nocardioides convexus TaxID=2712224 RepID=UPI00241892E9|nr:hypothetical protein [Nocardioides convexus]NHA00587.1 hypothetical protein [Nocardioides convexus]
MTAAQASSTSPNRVSAWSRVSSPWEARYAAGEAITAATRITRTSMSAGVSGAGRRLRAIRHPLRRGPGERRRRRPPRPSGPHGPHPGSE